MKREYRLRDMIKEGILDIFYIWKDELKNVFKDAVRSLRSRPKRATAGAESFLESFIIACNELVPNNIL